MKKIIFCLLMPLFLLIGCNSRSDINPSLLYDENNGIGIKGPIILEFPLTMKTVSVEQGIKTNPPNDLRFQWHDSKLFIFPKISFNYDQEYKIILEKGVTTEEGRELLKELTWMVKMHPLCIVYIGSATVFPEIWKTCLNDPLPVQLTETNGRLYDFDVSFDGNMIVFSAQNDMGGIDIWSMDRNGKNSIKLVDCEYALCSQASFSPDGQWIIYVSTMTKAGDILGGNTEQILIKNIVNGEITNLFSGYDLRISDLTWSPNNKSISFYEHISSSIWILDLKSNHVVRLPSSEGLAGSWNLDGSRFVFGYLELWGGIPFVKINQWVKNSGAIQHLFGDETAQYEYFFPQWRPQEDWIAVALRPVKGSASKQIMLFSSDGKKSLTVTNDQVFTFSSFSWSPNGEMILFQRFNPGVSDSVPEIGMWNMNDHSMLTIVKNASNPKWFP